MIAIAAAAMLQAGAAPVTADALCDFGPNLSHHALMTAFHITKPLRPAQDQNALRIEGHFVAGKGEDEDRSFYVYTSGDASLGFSLLYDIPQGQSQQDVTASLSTDKDRLNHWTIPWHPGVDDPVRLDVVMAPDKVTYRIYTSVDGFAGPFMTAENDVGHDQQIQLSNFGGKFKLTSVRFASLCPVPAS